MENVKYISIRIVGTTPLIQRRYNGCCTYRGVA